VHPSRTELVGLLTALVGPLVVVLALSPLLSGMFSGAAIGSGTAYDEARLEQVREVAQSWAVYFGTVVDGLERLPG
jgi:hypothetical protein